jgi:hypothetical protein
MTLGRASSESGAAEPGRPARRRIESCHGDFEAISTMMQSSWAASVTPPFLYTGEFLTACFEYPGADLALAPTIYDGASPIAFVAGFPRRLRIEGESCTVVLVALLTAAFEHRSRGLGIVVWSELVRRARAAGFDGMVNYCVEGEAMNRMIGGACRRLGVPVERPYSVQYLSKILPPAAGAAQDAAGDALVDAFVGAAAPVTQQAVLARDWNRAEATWQCTRPGAVSAVHAAGETSGVVNGYVMEIANARRSKCLVTDDVLWDGLADADRQTLVDDFVTRGAAAGAQIAVVPRQGYADLAPFEAAGFRASRRTVHAYLTLWTGLETPRSVPSFYLDVF